MNVLSLSEIARALGGKICGQQVLCPGPGHSHRDRSLSVRLAHDSPKGFVVHSYAGDDWRVCEQYVAERVGIDLDGWRRETPPDPINDMQRRARRRAAEERERGAIAARQLRAGSIWRAGCDPRGTIVETYLKSRGLELPDGIAGEVIRFVARCPFGEGEAVPAMVALMRDAVTGEPRAIHRTALTNDGRKIGRMMLAPTAGTAVMLDAEDAVTTGLAIGEGIETCLAARQLGIRPAWALCSTSGITGLPVLPGIETLTLLVENDENGASERACRAVGTRWHQAGRTVDFVRPRAGKDLNDQMMREGAPA